MNSFQVFASDFRKYFHEKKLIRWILTTYPKSCALVVLSISIGLGFYSDSSAKYHFKLTSDIRDSIHSNKEAFKKFDKILIYDGNTTTSNKD